MTRAAVNDVVRLAYPVRQAERSLPERRRPGRPSRLDDGAREVLLAAIRRGNRLATAAQLAGLSPSTVEEWMRCGRGLDARPVTPTYMAFVEDVEQAQAEAEAEAVGAIRDAARRDWRAAAWFLSNVSPDWRRYRQPPPGAPR